MPPTASELADYPELYTCELLWERGYSAHLLPIAARTYDIEASRGSVEFRISVKVSREEQHVRLGSRYAVLGLQNGNFVFAYMPRLPGAESALPSEPDYTLLILPAEVARVESLAIHDPYWTKRNKDPDAYPVIVEGHGPRYREIWARWLGYREAWHLLP